MTERQASRPRCAAIIGPYLSGKTSLLEAILFAAGAIPKQGLVKDHGTVGDPSPEARARQMSTEVIAATTTYLGEPWVFLDCPGNIEFAQETYNALMIADIAVVVCEPHAERAVTLAPFLKCLDDREIPHVVFINKMDTAAESPGDVVAALQAISSRPLILREVPIREGDGIVGYVDLVSERAYSYRPGQSSALVQLPETVLTEEQKARTGLLESLADFDDKLLEQLLEEVVPPTAEVYANLTRVLRADRVVPVFFGAAERSGGVRRLLKALRHEAPGPEAVAARLGVDPKAGEAVARCFKTYHMPHTGKLSLVRILRGEVADNSSMKGERVSGLYHLTAFNLAKQSRAVFGEVVAFGRMDGVKTGDVLTPSGKVPDGVAAWPAPLKPVYAQALKAEKQADEVKLSGMLARLVEEDPSLQVEQNADTNELVLWGQGTMHVQVALDRLQSKYKLAVKGRAPQVPYKETIRKAIADVHGRHKRQTGGHGQFGDVHLEIKPLPRGGGFEFIDAVVGGVVPRQFIPAVEAGVREYMQRGPLGFKLVDVSVRLFDGQYHSVDSSEMAFKTAGRLGMAEGLPKCEPVLLEPIFKVEIAVPSEFTSKIQRIVSGRRGQILGFDAKPGWPGWDQLTAFLPQAEMQDLIVELRSVTLGVGTFDWQFDHLQELTGRLADQIVQARAEAAA
ncbi:MAG: elongation factor G [Proteobacteria bacterium]|nr:elongation factor G [Pseudomonadota bacterium]